MKALISLLMVGGIVVTSLGSTNSYGADSPKSKKSLAEQYPGQWQRDFNVDISRALAQNNVRGCGEYKYKQNSLHAGNFLVYCSRDGETWTAYIVWPPINKIMGPYPPHASVR